MLKLFLALMLPLLMVSGHGQAAIPQTPAGHALQAWLDAMNGGTAARVSEYVKSMDSTQSVDWAREFERAFRRLCTSLGAQ